MNQTPLTFFDELKYQMRSSQKQTGPLQEAGSNQRAPIESEVRLFQHQAVSRCVQQTSEKPAARRYRSAERSAPQANH